MPLRDSGRTLHGVLERAARAHPDRPVVEFPGVASYSCAELWTASLDAAGRLHTAGVQPGDRVALLLGNRPEFLTTLFGLAVLGAVSMPMNTALPGEALAATLEPVGPCSLVTDAGFHEPVRAAVRAGARLSSVWSVGDAEFAGAGALPPGGPAPDAAPAQPWDLASILFTSGTTGVSKGVMWPHNMAITFAETSTWVMGYSEQDVIYTCLPLFHINALLTAMLPALLTGAGLVVAPRFSASRFWDDIATSRATTTNMMGSMGALLWRQTPRPVERTHALRLAMVLPLPADRAEFEQRFAVPTTEVYGSTDTGMPLGIPFGQRRPGSCGVVAPGWEVRLVDEDDEPVGRGEPGELVTRPLAPFVGQLGYWGMPEHTLTAMRNQWFHTGDLLTQDDEGWFTFLDRRGDRLRVSGENVSSFEVEEALLTHEDVAAAAVYGLPAELGEDCLVAAVILRHGRTCSPRDLLEHLRPKLPYFAVPRYVDVCQELPMTATQKVRKEELRARGLPAGAFDGGPPRRPAPGP